MIDQIFNYTIRKAVYPDISRMIKLLKILFSIETDFAFDELVQRKGLEMMLAENTDRCVKVAEIKQQIVGMCTAQILVSTAEGGKVALIEDLVVEDVYRGHGLGKKLLSAIEDWALAQGAKRLQLLADRDNNPALNFYQKLNWQSTRLICLHKKENYRS